MAPNLRVAHTLISDINYTYEIPDAKKYSMLFYNDRN